MNCWLKENIGPVLALLTVVGIFSFYGLGFFLKVDGAHAYVEKALPSREAVTVDDHR